MAFSRTFALCCVAIAAIAPTAALASGVDVLVFGDSWGTEGGASFQKMASAHGLSVKNVAIGGTTAKGWAGSPDCLKDAVAQAGGAKYVWLTIGGNDAIDGMMGGTPLKTILSQALANTKVFLDPLVAAYPDIKIVQFGYDVVAFDFGICGLLGDAIFSHICQGGAANITCCNQHMFELQTFVDSVSAAYPKQHTSVNLLGSMQAGSGKVPNATVGHPNPAYWTPDYLIQGSCIHATDAGYEMIFANLWKLYFAKHEP